MKKTKGQKSRETVSLTWKSASNENNENALGPQIRTASVLGRRPKIVVEQIFVYILTLSTYIKYAGTGGSVL
jgi:hypothetical protein